MVMNYVLERNPRVEFIGMEQMQIGIKLLREYLANISVPSSDLLLHLYRSPRTTTRMPAATKTPVPDTELQSCLARLGISDITEFVLPVSASHPKEPTLKLCPGQEDRTATESNSQDELVEKLLDLVSEYEQLANGAFYSAFVEGFSSLSRASFYSTRTFGRDSYDLRPYQACKVVTIEDSRFVLQDRLKAQAKMKKVETQTTSLRKRGKRTEVEKLGEDMKEEKTSVSELDASKSEKPFEAENSCTTSSHSKLQIASRISESDLSQFRDPIYQFGGLVPHQLRKTQDEFHNALVHCLRLLELQRKIESVMADIQL